MKKRVAVYARVSTDGQSVDMQLTLARKIASITLTMWKKGASFDPKQLKRQAA